MEVIEGEVKSEGIKKALIALLCSGVISGGFLFVCLFLGLLNFPLNQTIFMRPRINLQITLQPGDLLLLSSSG